MTMGTGSPSIEDLAEARMHIEALMHSGILNPHEKKHLRDVCDRIEDLVKERWKAVDQKDTAPKLLPKVRTQPDSP
jgi:hypothetical protein